MPRYFFDTSALAKVYRKELGSDLVDRIVTERGSHRFISRFTIVEMESVLALKFRTGDIDEQSLLIARRRLDADLGSRRLLVAIVSDEHLRGARQLLNRSWQDRSPSRSRRLATVRRFGTQTRWLGISFRRC